MLCCQAAFAFSCVTRSDFSLEIIFLTFPVLSASFVIAKSSSRVVSPMSFASATVAVSRDLPSRSRKSAKVSFLSVLLIVFR